MKILIAEKNTILRNSVRQIVKTVPGPKIIDEVSDGNLAFSKISTTNYDFVVLDVSLPGMTGLDILQEMRGNNNRTRTLIYSSIPQEQYANRAFKLGASGYLSKNSAFEVLKMAVGQASEGENYLSSIRTEKQVSNSMKIDAGSSRKKISEKMFQVMVMLTNGRSAIENCALTVHVG